MRKLETLLTEKKYRNKPETKAYQKEYGKYYRMLQKGEITLAEFEALKPNRKDFKNITI